MEEYLNKFLIMTEEDNIYFKKVIMVGFVKMLLVMIKIQLEIIVT